MSTKIVLIVDEINSKASSGLPISEAEKNAMVASLTNKVGYSLQHLELEIERETKAIEPLRQAYEKTEPTWKYKDATPLNLELKKIDLNMATLEFEETKRAEIASLRKEQKAAVLDLDEVKVLALEVKISKTQSLSESTNMKSLRKQIEDLDKRIKENVQLYTSPEHIAYDAAAKRLDEMRTRLQEFKLAQQSLFSEQQ